MLRGIDTSFLVVAEVAGHPGHSAAKRLFDRLLASEDSLALAPQVLPEFIHIVTDSKRFSEPLPIEQAVTRAEAWWNAKEVKHALPTDESVRLCLEWLTTHRLGRKRLLDTQLAATYYCNGIRSLLSTNARDFGVFDCFEVVVPEEGLRPETSPQRSQRTQR